MIEAALYVAGRPLDLRTLGNIANTRSKKIARKLAEEIMNIYLSRNTALEILELEGERFVLQLKPEFTPTVRKLATRPFLSSGPLKTLSYIAYRQPVPQSHIIEVRGHHAYYHLKQLEDLDLIIRERSGRTRVVRTTEFFADYFGLSHNYRIMKRQLGKIFEDITKKNISNKL